MDREGLNLGRELAQASRGQHVEFLVIPSPFYQGRFLREDRGKSNEYLVLMYPLTVKVFYFMSLYLGSNLSSSTRLRSIGHIWFTFNLWPNFPDQMTMIFLNYTVRFKVSAFLLTHILLVLVAVIFTVLVLGSVRSCYIILCCHCKPEVQSWNLCLGCTSLFSTGPLYYHTKFMLPIKLRWNKWLSKLTFKGSS